MAELVQAGLEGMLTELEQMQRVELLSPDEVREVVKKRQRFEYKMQKLKIKSQGAYETWTEGNKALLFFQFQH